MTGGTILIAAYSARALAESAARAGYRPAAVDAFADLDLERVAPGAEPVEPYSPEALVRVAERASSDAVVYGAGLENHPDLVERLARGRALLGNGPKTLARVREIAEVGSVLRAVGIAVPRTLNSGGGGNADPRTRWLRKPAKGGGGVGIEAWSRGRPLGPGEILQEWVEGVAGSAAFVADGRRAVLLALTRQIVGDPAFGALGFRYCGSVLPLAEDAARLESLAEQAARAARALTEAFALRGACGIDFVVREDAIHVVEVNPRYTASMELVERATGLSIFDAHARACRGSLPDARALLHPAPALGKGILFARRKVRLGDTRGWLGRGVSDVPRPGATVPRGGPVCTLFATGPDPAACETALRRRAAAWTARLAAGPRQRRAS